MVQTRDSAPVIDTLPPEERKAITKEKRTVFRQIIAVPLVVDEVVKRKVSVPMKIYGLSRAIGDGRGVYLMVEHNPEKKQDFVELLLLVGQAQMPLTGACTFLACVDDNNERIPVFYSAFLVGGGKKK